MLKKSIFRMGCKQMQTSIQQFRHLTQKLMSYNEALAMLHWDLHTGAPSKSVDLRTQTIGLLTEERFRLSISEEMKSCLETLAQLDVWTTLSPAERKMVQDARQECKRNEHVPPKLYREYVILTAQAESVWTTAKKKADYTMFAPYLRAIVTKKKQVMDYWDVKEKRYDALLDCYEPGMTVAQLDRMLDELKQQLIPFVHALQDKGQACGYSFLYDDYEIGQQKQLSLYLLQQIGYDFAAGRLDESLHPFMIHVNAHDIRITNQYKQNDLISGIFSALHEGGHALYEQNIRREFVGTPLYTGTSFGIHESQSRLWENMIGRSRAFWSCYYSEVQRLYPKQLQQIDMDTFYRAINRVEPSLIRTEADEVTYNLHIIIRYELEKLLFHDELSVEELPAAWNEKYQLYLGVCPKHAGEGVLQDIHWAGGDFGYFPSYTLGNLYAAQIMHRMRKQLPLLEQQVATGHLLSITNWLTENIYQHGKLFTPAELMENVTNESLNPQYFINYIKAKFHEMYYF